MVIKSFVVPKVYVVVIDLSVFVYVHHHHTPSSMYENHTFHPLHPLAYANIVF